MSEFYRNPLLGNGPLPVDVVFHPSWWFANEGITFDEDFFFHPKRRVETERAMENALYERWGGYGLGEAAGRDEPMIGAVHLAAGYIIPAMLGCQVRFAEDSAPQVLCAEGELRADAAGAFGSPVFKKVADLIEALRSAHGRVAGDINWGGILNAALDLRGQKLFMDFYDQPDETRGFLADIAGVIQRFTALIQAATGSTSISVNRTVRHIPKPVYLHSECSLTMLSVELYESFLRTFDEQWSRQRRPFGIHFCGHDPHRFAESFAALPHLDFLDVGWGGDVKTLRQHLPRTFLNIRLNPVDIAQKDPREIEAVIRELVGESGNPWLTGLCCINMDSRVQDKQVEAILSTARELRNGWRRDL